MKGQDEDEKNEVKEEVGAAAVAETENLAELDNPVDPAEDTLKVNDTEDASKVNSAKESSEDIVIDLSPEGKGIDKKKVAMIVAGILVVIGVGAGAWWWRSQKGESEIEILSEEEKELAEKARVQYEEGVLELTGISVAQTEEINEEVDKILDPAYNKEISVDEAISKFQELIDRADSDAKKAKYYDMRSVMLEHIDAGGKDSEIKEKMLADAYEAERLYPTVATARRIASLEEQLGNEKAKEEYEEIVKIRQDERSGNEQ